MNAVRSIPDKDNPILSLRNIAKGRRGGLSRGETLTMLIEHWDAFREWKSQQQSSSKKKQLKLV